MPGKYQPRSSYNKHVNPRGGQGHPAQCDMTVYTDDEREFLAAMDRYRRDNNCRFPTWVEALAVLRALGYRRVAEPTDPPKRVRRFKREDI